MAEAYAHKQGLARSATGRALKAFPAFQDTPFADWAKHFKELAEQTGEADTINNEQFVTFLTSHVKISAPEAAIFYSMFDQNADGSISASEFVSTMATVATGSLEEKLNFFFDMYDADGNGFLKGEELYAAMMAAKGLTEHDYDADVTSKFGELLRTLDQSGDGRIAKAELVAAVTADVQLIDSLGSWLNTRPDLKEAHLVQIKALFTKLDADGSGNLQKKEIVSFCKANVADRAAAGNRATKMMAKMDADKNNKVSESEFVDFFAHFYAGKSDEEIEADLAKISAHKFE